MERTICKEIAARNHNVILLLDNVLQPHGCQMMNRTAQTVGACGSDF
jgi:hypothetical protein